MTLRKGPSRSRSALARNVPVVGRLFRTAQRSPPPPAPVKGQRGAPRQQGPVLGSPKTWATPSAAWPPHPQAAGAFLPAWVGIGHRVFPGRRRRVGVVGRPPRDGPATPNRSKALGRLKPREALCSTAVSLSPPTRWETEEERWAIDIALRDGQAYDGRAQDPGRTCEPMVGAQTLRLLLAAARPLWCIASSAQEADGSLQRLRPWYHHKGAPRQFDVAWACRDVWQEAGIFPLPRFFTAVADNQHEIDKPQPIAA